MPFVAGALGADVVRRRGQAALPVAAEAQFVLVCGPESHAEVQLPAREHEFHGAFHFAGGQGRGDGVHVGTGGTAEGPADERRDDADAAGRNAELAGQGAHGAHHVLGLLPDGQPVTVPACDGGVRLHRVVVVAGHPVCQVQPDRGRFQGCVGVAARIGLRVVVGFGDADVRRDGLGIVGDPHQARGVLCALQCGRHHDRDGLSEEPDPVVLEGTQPLARWESPWTGGSLGALR